jgi:hypothetical protein
MNSISMSTVLDNDRKLPDSGSVRHATTKNPEWPAMSDPYLTEKARYAIRHLKCGGFISRTPLKNMAD